MKPTWFKPAPSGLTSASHANRRPYLSLTFICYHMLMRLALTLALGLLTVGLFSLGGPWSLLGVALFFVLALLFEESSPSNSPPKPSGQA